VFLSYRREETRHAAGRIADRIGPERVFMDVDTIEPGADFAEAINEAVASCALLLALIGPRWLDATDRRRRRRLDDPHDLVVLEIVAALQRDVRVVPVLLDGAEMPDRDDLPEQLRPLVRRQAVRVDHETFASDVTRLLDMITRILDPMPSSTKAPSRRPAVSTEPGPMTSAASSSEPAVGPASPNSEPIVQLAAMASAIPFTHGRPSRKEIAALAAAMHSTERVLGLKCIGINKWGPQVAMAVTGRALYLAYGSRVFTQDWRSVLKTIPPIYHRSKSVARIPMEELTGKVVVVDDHSQGAYGQATKIRFRGGGDVALRCESFERTWIADMLAVARVYRERLRSDPG
jgi:hypothetical protein